MNKVGYIQFKPLLGDQNSNILQIEKLLEQASGSELIVLPELANSGYNFASRDDAIKYSEEISKSNFVEFLVSSAKKYNTNIVCGVNERVGEKLFNTTVLVGPNGYIGKYQKIHLFLNEKDIYETGSVGLPVFDIGFCKTSMLICFDYLFPEVWRIVGMNGADIVCHPSNLITTNAQKCVPAQAFMNKMFVITANRYGTESDITFSGNSFITNPDAIIIDQAGPNSDSVSVIDIEISEAREKMVTSRNHVFNDRKPDAYKGLI